MEITPELIQKVATSMEVPSAELEKFVALGEKRTWPKGDYLFHESTPRQFFGIVLSGKINLQRGLSGRNVTIACLTDGAVIGESLFIDELSHSVSGLALEDVEIWAIARDRIDAFRAEKPELFYRLVARAARRISLRLRETTELLLHSDRNRALVSGYRLEHDSLGEREVSNGHYYGVQTMRAVENFPFSGIRLSHFQHLVNAFAHVKRPRHPPMPNSVSSTPSSPMQSARPATASLRASCTKTSSSTWSRGEREPRLT